MPRCILWREDCEVWGGEISVEHVCCMKCAFEGGKVVFLGCYGDISWWDEKRIDYLYHPTGEGEIPFNKSASAALATDKGYNISCLLDKLNS